MVSPFDTKKIAELISIKKSTRNQSLEQSLKLINLEALFLKRGLQYETFYFYLLWYHIMNTGSIETILYA